MQCLSLLLLCELSIWFCTIVNIDGHSNQTQTQNAVQYVPVEGSINVTTDKETNMHEGQLEKQIKTLLSRTFLQSISMSYNAQGCRLSYCRGIGHPLSTRPGQCRKLQSRCADKQVVVFEAISCTQAAQDKQ